MNADNKNGSDTAPVTREVTRTPVSAKLADIMRQLDDTLMAEHGAFAFAYAILVGDGLAGASNARDGFVPPWVRAANRCTRAIGGRQLTDSGTGRAPASASTRPLLALPPVADGPADEANPTGDLK